MNENMTKSSQLFDNNDCNETRKMADAYTNMITNSYRLAVSNADFDGDLGFKFYTNVGPSVNKCYNVLPKIKKVIFNPPATIVFWDDNIKTVVKCQNDEIFDQEKGLAMAISKRALGNKGNYYNIFKKHTTDVTFQNNSIIVNNPISKSLNNIRDGLSKLADKLYKSNNYIRKNKYGDFYDSRFYFAGKRHKIVCAGTCYHVKNIKKENALVYATYNDAIKDGCVPCKHCNGVSKYPLSIEKIG